MAVLKEKLSQQFPGMREEIRAMVKAHGDKQISEVTVAQAYGGMRGVKAMICDTSLVDPETGLIIRGIPILELTSKLPEEIFWLLLTGELPTDDECKDLRAEFADRNEVPQYVWDVLKAMPADSHPMAMLNAAILSMQHESEFHRRYREMAKGEYWEAVLEDALSLLGKLPNIAAAIYRMRFDKGPRIEPNPELDWAANYAYMLGLPGQDETCYEMMRLYLTLHTDHEGGNASAFTCHVVGSALADPFYAVSAGLSALAGPLHGLANQECLDFILKLRERYGGVPSSEQVKEASWELLNSGKVIPGYGHGVLRAEDPRFTALFNFAKEHFADDEIVRTVQTVYETVPGVLKEHGKAKNPWPNVDAGSGALLYHYGLAEFPYYTVLFSVSRAMGMLAQLIINRAIGSPITRPKSVGTDWIKQQVGMAQAG
ncbi:citrate (Si)-synthase [bacterium]|nr:citrate (Si)-synthase [bacterium]